MRAKSRLRLLILVMMSVALAGGGNAIFVLYRAAFKQQRSSTVLDLSLVYVQWR